MLPGLEQLDSEFTTSNTPDFIESVYYLFWDKGVGLNDFNTLPIPYIMGILKVHTYAKEKEEEEIKKQNRKK